MSVKKITKFNNSFFRIKICSPNVNYVKFEQVFDKAISGFKFSYCRSSEWNDKVSFQHLKLNLISDNLSNNTNSANLSSINLVNVIKGNYDLNAPNIPNGIFQNPISHSNTEKTYFCLSWNLEY